MLRAFLWTLVTRACIQGLFGAEEFTQADGSSSGVNLAGLMSDRHREFYPGAGLPVLHFDVGIRPKAQLQPTGYIGQSYTGAPHGSVPSVRPWPGAGILNCNCQTVVCSMGAHP